MPARKANKRRQRRPDIPPVPKRRLSPDWGEVRTGDKRTSVNLDRRTVDLLRRIGAGNISYAVRLLTRRYGTILIAEKETKP